MSSMVLAKRFNRLLDQRFACLNQLHQDFHRLYPDSKYWSLDPKLIIEDAIHLSDGRLDIPL